MSPKRLIALVSGVLFLFLLGFAWTHGRNDFSDAEAAIANVPKLKPGMTLAGAIAALHPERTQGVSQMSYSMRPGANGGYEMIHALSPTCYVVLEYAPQPKPKAKSYAEPSLKAWQLHEGAAPREDVTIGRAFQAGSFRFYY